MRPPFRAALLIAAATAASAVAACAPDDGGGPSDALESELRGVDPARLPERAEAFLDTDRPWRAARAMRRYLEAVPDAGDDARLLAARAEAGWGAWQEARTLLEAVDDPGRHGDGVGLYLLGRALDETGRGPEDAARAVDAYRAYLAAREEAGGEGTGQGAGDGSGDGRRGAAAREGAARLRLGLALLRAGDPEGARTELDAARARAGDARVWLAPLAAQALARGGDTAGVRRAVEGVDDGMPGLRAWRARVHAARAAGDPARARALANRARAWADTDATRAEFLVAAGASAVEMGDTAAGRDAFRSAIDLDASGRHARAAADRLREGTPSAADRLALARVLGAQGLHEASLGEYEAWLESGEGGPSERREVRLAYADALSWAGRFDEVEEALRPVPDGDAARLLRAGAAHRLGRVDDAVEIYLGMAERRAGSGAGARGLFLAADALHDAGRTGRAAELYRRLVARYPGTDRAGHAMMRLAGLAFLDEAWDEAAGTWDEYRRRWPNGSRALEATYWAGRARAGAGDRADAERLFREVRRAEPDSYYALLASERLGEPFWPVPMGDDPSPDPAASARVEGWMRGVDLLAAAGFPEEASDEVDRVVERVGRDRATRYALAEALIERGYGRRSVLLGIGLGTASPPGPRLLRILHPFAARTLVTEESRERGIDPFVAAALIRQESLYEARATSHVGARGLMQLMPATGGEVAEREGLDRWDPDLLYLPEINVHLGTALLAEHLEAYDGSLPAVFSAYNAGPHRVEWWSAFPEYGRDELFTERIPYAETREYVKILTRNRAVYEGLYGGAAAAPAPEGGEAGGAG